MAENYLGMYILYSTHDLNISIRERILTLFTNHLQNHLFNIVLNSNTYRELRQISLQFGQTAKRNGILPKNTTSEITNDLANHFAKAHHSIFHILGQNFETEVKSSINSLQSLLAKPKNE